MLPVLMTARFLAEVAAVAALAWLGATLPDETAGRIALGAAAPLALVVTWALVVAPKARNPLPPLARELIGTSLLVGVAGLLVAAGRPEWGIALAAVVIVGQVLVLARHASGPVYAAQAGRG
jgi:Protein of unknown function (DUF2568)